MCLEMSEEVEPINKVFREGWFRRGSLREDLGELKEWPGNSLGEGLPGRETATMTALVSVRRRVSSRSRKSR